MSTTAVPSAAHPPDLSSVLVCAMLLVVTFGCGWQSVRLHRQPAVAGADVGNSPSLFAGITAGLGFSLSAIGARWLAGGFDGDRQVDDVSIVIVLVTGVLVAQFFTTMMLNGAHPTLALSVSEAVSAVTPVLVGLAFQGDQLRHGRAPVAVLGLVVMTAGVALLAASPARSSPARPDAVPAMASD